MAPFRRMLVFALLFTLHSIAGAAVHERHALPYGWREAGGLVSSETVVTLQVALYVSS